ncbi:MAG: hypoxanthine phosphoribosyltransferase [Clostridiaceae bacterium]|jgi:hypoxanthine phosphoribosyltransferase|nr:hypoxanthine phosphoribosyltransferase [Clostridiaceae bacterium]
MKNEKSQIREVLVTKEQIAQRVKELGQKISEDYKGEELVLIGVLKGAFIFLADLIREITIPVDMDFIAVSSYADGTKTSGVVRLIKDMDISISGKHVLIIEDIVDTGLTLNHLKELFSTRSPKSLKICAIFDKPSRRLIPIDIDYKGIEIPNKFVIGYGLDYAGKYRNLPDLCVLDTDSIEDS